MSQVKVIYWRNDMKRNEKGERFANVHLLRGYTDETISAFQKMAAEMRKTFPFALDNQIRCAKVHKSRTVEGFSVICWDVYLPEGKYPGWDQKSDNQVEYCL